MSMEILQHHVGWGRISRTGESLFGHDDLRAQCRMDLDGWQVIGAHAPSAVHIRTDEAIEIRGVLNGSAKLHRHNPIDCWASTNYVGTLTMPGESTEPIIVPSGEHTLIMKCGNEEWRHSFWIWKPIAYTRPKTAVVAIGCYPVPQVFENLFPYAHSARQQGIWLDVFGVGMKYSERPVEPGYYDHYTSKILRLSSWIRSLPQEVTRILYVDANDSLLLGDLQEIERAFDSFSSPIVMSAERCCSPQTHYEFSGWFEPRFAHRNYPNAGCFMGERSAICESLYTIQGLGNDERYKKHLIQSCDQYHWQAAYLMGRVPVALDSEFKLFASIVCEDDFKHLSDNSRFMADGSRLVDRASGNRPSVAHFGPCFPLCRDSWMGHLGL